MKLKRGLKDLESKILILHQKNLSRQEVLKRTRNCVNKYTGINTFTDLKNIVFKIIPVKTYAKKPLKLYSWYKVDSKTGKHIVYNTPWKKLPKQVRFSYLQLKYNTNTTCLLVSREKDTPTNKGLRTHPTLPDSPKVTKVRFKNKPKKPIITTIKKIKVRKSIPYSKTVITLANGKKKTTWYKTPGTFTTSTFFTKKGYKLIKYTPIPYEFIESNTIDYNIPGKEEKQKKSRYIKPPARNLNKAEARLFDATEKKKKQAKVISSKITTNRHKRTQRKSKNKILNKLLFIESLGIVTTRLLSTKNTKKIVKEPQKEKQPLPKKVKKATDYQIKRGQILKQKLEVKKEKLRKHLRAKKKLMLQKHYDYKKANK